MSQHPRFHTLAQILFLSVALLLPGVARAQVLNTDPKRDPGAKPEPLRQVRMTALDYAALEHEDAIRAAEGLAPRYAIPNAVQMTPDNAGAWTTLPDGRRRWTLDIACDNARSMNLGFTHYVMPDDGRLDFRAADGTVAVRPFTAADNEEHGELWTPPINTNHVVVEVTLPVEQVPALDLVLGSINVGYRRFGEIAAEAGAEPRSGSCNVDVACSTADPWESEVNSVAVISTGGSTFCTGFMVNNTAQDLKPYFMTANHCGIGAGNAASLVVFWNYQNSTCRGIPGGGGVGDGVLTDFQTGSFFRAAASVSDFTLVELDEMPNPDWQVSYAGWDRQGLNPPSGACIHHPNTDEKRISLYDIAVRPDRPSHGSSWGCSDFPGPGDNTHIKVYWSLGVTEPGSSGSPLFDNNHRVIGQLHGGASACGQTGDNLSDCYGRISRSWTGNGTSSSRLSDWLDPGNTGALFVDTISGLGMGVAPAGPTLHLGQVGGPFTNPSVVYTLSNPSPNPINYTVSLTAGFGILINGGVSPVNGTLAALGGTADITVTLGPAVNALGAGIYNETIDFTDTTNNRTLSRLHTVEVGTTGFDTSPAGGLSAGGPVGGPFTATQVYTLTSTRPTPVTVQIAASDPWISLNGGAGPLNVVLTGVGDTANVTVGYSAAANALAAGLYSGSVTFTNASGGSGTTSRPVALDVGRYSYNDGGLPVAINDNATVTRTITVTDNYCIADVDVRIDITHTYIGDLTVDVTSPGGTTVRLHNRTGGSADDIHKLYNDGVTNPDGPGTLADFSGTQVQGVWTLTVRDNASADVGTLDTWTLKIASTGSGACPTRELIHDYPLTTNPGWSTQGQWAYGVPLGSGGDPSSGFTGSNVYGYNLAGQYPNNMASVQYLTTTGINCSGLTGTQLRFRRWLGVESSSYDHASIQVSNNGMTWTTIYDHTGGSFTDPSWQLMSYDISAVADGQGAIFIRWGMGPTDSSVTYCGWNIDDVQIWAFVADPCEGILLADVNGDTFIDGADVQMFVDTLLNPGSAKPPELCAADMTQNDAVEMSDVAPFVNEVLGQ
ncbi:MAG: hypothetical protein DCC65_03520 [Planctomycetota bacterium]|nr:MAG: hypothetical protein DCC65_03520 [Planctomycetota bacterium]